MTVLPNIYDREQLREFAAAPSTPPLTPEELARSMSSPRELRPRRRADEVQGHDDAPNRSPPNVTRAIIRPLERRRRSDRTAKRCAAAKSYCSGQSRSIRPPESSSTAALRPNRRAIDNLGAVLVRPAYYFADVVKTTIFLVDINDFASVNTVYGRAFDAAKPARSTVAVAGLPSAPASKSTASQENSPVIPSVGLFVIPSVAKRSRGTVLVHCVAGDAANGFWRSLDYGASRLRSG